MIPTLVFNGWAAGAETWDLCTFAHDWLFDYLEELEGLPERVARDFDAFALVGFSMGSTRALETLLAFPERVRALVLVSATARMMEKRDEGWAGMSTRRRAALKFGTQFVFRNDPSPLYEESNLDRGLDYLQETDLRAALLETVGRVPALREIPVAILQSERDGIVRPANAAFLKRVFPQARVEMIPGAEHVLPVVAPERVDAAVNEVLRAAKSGATDLPLNPLSFPDIPRSRHDS